MLYTRCPRCETTFRISEAALQQAEGQVRCGRCGHIFDANESLTDRLDDADDATAGHESHDAVAAGEQRTAVASAAAAGAASGDAYGESPPAGTDAAAAAIPATGTNAPAEPDEPDGTGGNSATAVASVMSANEIDAVLEEPVLAPEWLVPEIPEPPRSRLWTAAAAAAFLVLCIQVAHHFRSSLAGNALIGPLVQRVYSTFGRPVIPDWDVTRYTLIDWVAVEDPGEQSQRNLIIRTQLRNDAGRAQPFPMIQLRLLDRYEQAVGARLFESDEYLAAAPARELMDAGEVVDAELVIVDPGTDAYGFELGVCLALATGIVCDTDQTFR